MLGRAGCGKSAAHLEGQQRELGRHIVVGFLCWPRVKQFLWFFVWFFIWFFIGDVIGLDGYDIGDRERDDEGLERHGVAGHEQLEEVQLSQQDRAPHPPDHTQVERARQRPFDHLNMESSDRTDGALRSEERPRVEPPAGEKAEEPLEMPGTAEEAAEEIAEVSPEGLPRSPKVGPGSIRWMVRLVVLGLVFVSIVVGIFASWAAAAALFAFCFVALFVVNPVLAATRQRTDDQRTVIDRNHSGEA